MRAEFPFSMHGSRRSSEGNGTGSRLRFLRLQQPYGQCGRPGIGRVGNRFFWGWGRGSLCRLWKAVLSGRTVMFEHTINNLDNVVENTTSAESQIRDTDMATEMVKYSNNNILAQAGQAMLAQSNQANQGVLSLLQ